MRLDWLADVLRDEGCTVLEHSGWSTRTMEPFDSFTPEGLIDHHTAGSSVIPNYPDPPFYSNTSLESKCNLTIRPDGVCVTLNAGYAYDSGDGVPAVLAAVRGDTELPDLDQYDAADSILLGNRWYIDIEVQHLGNGDPIVPVQREALIRANVAICRRMGWDPRYRVIGHLEWAPKRKFDPRWDGTANPMPGIRADTLALLQGDDMPLTDDDVQKIWFHRIEDPATPTADPRGAQFLLAQARGDAFRARVAAETSLQILRQGGTAADGTPLTDAEIERIADAVVEEIRAEWND